jgi:uncharacterized phage-like protein YoqJ
MPPKICCFTGHRIIRPEQQKFVEEELEHLVSRAIAAGFDTFISGFASGADLLFAEIIAAKKKEFSVKLIAAIPYRGRLKSSDPEFQALLGQCDEVVVVCEEYSRTCYHERNRWMVDHAQAMIAVFDGRQTGGTFYTIQYAKSVGMKVAMVRL